MLASNHPSGHWACSTCTFLNSKPLGLACEVCASHRAPPAYSMAATFPSSEVVDDSSEEEDGDDGSPVADNNAAADTDESDFEEVPAMGPDRDRS